jgi:cysteinyl-tRNA synthetase
VRAALCDNFDTPKAVNELSQLVTAANKYLQKSPADIKIPLVRQVSKFVFKILSCFGLYEEGDYPAVTGEGETGASMEEHITPLMNALAIFRHKVKQSAKDPTAIFKLSDELRDDILPYLGVRLEDKGAESIWKFENKEDLIKERENALAEKQKKEEEKRLRQEAELKKKSTSGKDWFKTFETDKFSKFDEETGLPTHDDKGKELSKEIVNSLKKKQAAQQKKYEKWLEQQSK